MIASHPLHWRLFQRPEHLVSWQRVVLWWELRRLAFNLIVGATGLLTCFLCGLLFYWYGDRIDAALASAGVGGGSPLLYIAPVILFGIGANVCYTGGWIAELIARRIWGEQAEHFGKISFALGLVFSVLLTLAPVAIFLGFVFLVI